MKMITRPHLIRIVCTRVPTIRTFNFARKVYAGDTWSRKLADKETRARKEERDLLLALKMRLKARTDHLNEMDNHLYDPMGFCLSVQH